MPTWVAAAASISALAFGAVAAAYAKKTYLIESDRDRVRQELLVRAQGAQISGWWGQPGSSQNWGVFLRNGSEVPVFQVHATVLGPDDTQILEAHMPVLPPGPPLFRPLQAAGEHNESALITGGRRVRITFTDEAGKRWIRDENGKLAQFEARLVVVATDEARANVLNQFGDEFRDAYGVTLACDVIHTSISDKLAPLFATSLRKGDAVDALIGAHDWIGGLAQQGLIEPIVLSQEHRAAFRPWTLDSLTWERQLYGLPTTLDSIALIRNVDLAPRAPATMEDLIATGNDLRHRGKVTETFAVRITDKGDPFQLWPVFASAGGSLFGRAGGAWDPRRVELDSPGSITAFEWLRSVGEHGSRLLRRSMDQVEAFELFQHGRTPYLISGSDGLQDARHAGLRVAVSPIPPFTRGKPARAMSLVHSLFIAKEGQNQLLAHDLFSDYLTHRSVMSALSENVVCPVALRDNLGQDADVQQYQNICEASDPMPSFVGMRHIWEIVGAAQAAVIGGAEVETTARAAAKEVALALKSGEAET